MESARRRLVLSAAVGLLPFLFAPVFARWLAARAAASVAAELDGAGSRLAGLSTYVEPVPLEPTPEAHVLDALDGQSTTAPPDHLAAKADAVPSAPRPREADAASSPCDDPTNPACGFPKPIGVFVRRERVMAAADAGIRPSGAPVPANAWRPAGLALSGVAALGVGLHDGDVLTRAAGPATSEGAVVGQVIWALRHRAKAMSGEAWRGRQRILITVELPELVKVDTPSEPRQTADR